MYDLTIFMCETILESPKAKRKAQIKGNIEYYVNNIYLDADILLSVGDTENLRENLEFLLEEYCIDY